MNPLEMLKGSNRTAILALAGVAAVLLALIVGGWWGWSHGSESARNKLEEQYASNLADAYREAAIKQQAETTRANALAADLILSKRTIETERLNQRGRIAYVTREVPADCSFAPDAVRLWNDAWGLSGAGLP